MGLHQQHSGGFSLTPRFCVTEDVSVEQSSPILVRLGDWKTAERIVDERRLEFDQNQLQLERGC